jgi:hypothetical protein
VVNNGRRASLWRPCERISVFRAGIVLFDSLLKFGSPRVVRTQRTLDSDAVADFPEEKGRSLIERRSKPRELMEPVIEHLSAQSLGISHTDQPHPHVHMVVKAEGEDGRRLHIDKEILREWREDFARMMREQGIAANATPRVTRGRSKGTTKDPIYRAQRRGASTALRHQVTSVAKELKETGTVRVPSRKKLLETRNAVVDGWMRVADILDRQGEMSLAGDIREALAASTDRPGAYCSRNSGSPG